MNRTLTGCAVAQRIAFRHSRISLKPAPVLPHIGSCRYDSGVHPEVALDTSASTLLAFQNAKPSVAFEGSQLNIFVVLDILFAQLRFQLILGNHFLA